MSEPFLCNTEFWKSQISSVNQRLTTAVDGKNYRVAYSKRRAILVAPIRDALRRELGWSHSTAHRISFLYTPCRELFSPTRLSQTASNSL